MASRLPHLVVDYNDGTTVNGVGWLRLGSKAGDSRITQVFYQEQFDDEGIEPVESLKVLMRDMDGDMPDVVGTMHRSETGEWGISFDPDDLTIQ